MDVSMFNGGPSLESILVDQALNTVLEIPSIKSDLDTNVRNTEREIELLKHQLNKNEELLSKALEVLSQCKENLAVTLQQIWISNAKSMENQKRCQLLQNEIAKLAVENVDNKSRANRKRLEIAKISKLHEEYREKMECHKERVQTAEIAQPWFRQLKADQEKLRSLTQKRDEYVQKFEEESSSDVSGLQLEFLDADISRTILMIEQEKEKQEKLRQQKDVLNKKNAARKLRLRNQLKEMMARSQHWNDEIRHLENAILLLQKELEE